MKAIGSQYLNNLDFMRSQFIGITSPHKLYEHDLHGFIVWALLGCQYVLYELDFLRINFPAVVVSCLLTRTKGSMNCA